MNNLAKAVADLRILTKLIDRGLSVTERTALLRRIAWRTNRLAKDSRFSYNGHTRARHIRDSSEYLLDLSDGNYTHEHASVMRATQASELYELAEMVDEILRDGKDCGF